MLPASSAFQPPLLERLNLVHCNMMKSVIAFGHPLRTEIRDVPIPIPGPNEILVRVICCGANPKDWKMPEVLESHLAINQGQDMSGLVEAVGENVSGFRRGDRVAAAHPLIGPSKSAFATSCFMCFAG